MTLAAVIGTDALAEVWVSWMVHMSWQVALLAGIAWSLSAVFRRSSAGLRYTLWLLVFVKLVVPPWWATPWSAGTLLARLPVTVGGQGISQLDYGRWAVGDRRRAEQDAPVVGPDGRGSKPTGAGRYVADVPRSSAALAAMAVWALVAGAVGTVLLAQWMAYARKVTRTAAPAPPPVHEALRRQREALGVRRPVRVCVSDAVTTPGLFGARWPLILLPAHWEEEFSAADLESVIAHELAHVKRGDLAVGWTTAVLTCLYWFHPIVWLVNFVLRREREMACDDMALLSTQQPSKAYASTILRVAESFDGKVPAGAGLVGMLELSDNLLQRIRSIGDEARPRRVGWRAASV